MYVPLGVGPGSAGTLTVDGGGSSFNTSSLHVGDSGGAGTLTVSNGGTVTAGNVLVAAYAGSTGTVNIGAAAGQAPVPPVTIAASSIRFRTGTRRLLFHHTRSNSPVPVPAP